MDKKERAEATEALKSVITGIRSNRRGSGYLVETKQGKGRTFHGNDLINGKVPVFLSDGRQMLCRPEGIKVIGFID